LKLEGDRGSSFNQKLLGREKQKHERHGEKSPVKSTENRRCGLTRGGREPLQELQCEKREGEKGKTKFHKKKWGRTLIIKNRRRTCRGTKKKWTKTTSVGTTGKVKKIKRKLRWEKRLKGTSDQGHASFIQRAGLGDKCKCGRVPEEKGKGSNTAPGNELKGRVNMWSATKRRKNLETQ